MLWETFLVTKLGHTDVPSHLSTAAISIRQASNGTISLKLFPTSSSRPVSCFTETRERQEEHARNMQLGPGLWTTDPYLCSNSNKPRSLHFSHFTRITSAEVPGGGSKAADRLRHGGGLGYLLRHSASCEAIYWNADSGTDRPATPQPPWAVLFSRSCPGAASGRRVAARPGHARISSAVRGTGGRNTASARPRRVT